MNCRECQGLFSEILDGRLPAGIAAEARAHLSACSSCSEGYRDFARTLASLRSEPLERVPDGFEEAVLERTVLFPPEAAPGTHGAALRALSRASRRPVPAVLAAAGTLAAAGILAAFLLARFLPSRPAAEVIDAGHEKPAQAEEVRKLRGEMEVLQENLRQARAENDARAVAAAAGEQERSRQAREREAMQESLSRKQERCDALEKEKQGLGEALDRLREERDGLARLVEDLQRRIDSLTPPPEPPLPEPAPAPRRVAAAPPPVLQGPAAVALDRRRGSEGELSIDLRGPDSRVVPGLIALALAEDDELGNLALNLLRERVGTLPAGGPDEQPAEEVSPPRAFFQNVGHWLGERVGLEPDREEEQEAPPLTAGERRREVERIEGLWRSLHAGGNAPARKL